MNELPGRTEPAINSGLCVVTGATGHIGNVLVRRLLARGVKVRALILPSEDLMPLANLKLDLVPGDIRRPASLDAAFTGADVVFHLAGIISISPGQTRNMHEVNVLGTRNVVRAAIAAGIRRLVYTSSVHAFVLPPAGTSICESSAIDPNRVMGDYGQSKARATAEVLAGISQGLDSVLAFPSGVMGPFDFRRSEMGQLIVDFAQRKLPAYIDGAYDFVDVRDVADGLILAAERGRAGEGYLLTGAVIAVRKILDVLTELTGVRPPRFRIPYPLARAISYLTPAYYTLTRGKPRFTTYSIDVLNSNCLMDSSKACRELGYRPRPIRQSIVDSLQWFREQGILLPSAA